MKKASRCGTMKPPPMFPVNMAALTQKWEEFDQVVVTVQPDLKSRLSQAIGDGFVRRAGYSVEQKNFAEAAKYLATAEKYGLTDVTKPWLPTVTGDALSAQAKLKGNTPEADRLFAEAAQKYAEAVRIKPDYDSAHFNGAYLAALLEQVRECCESLAKWKQYEKHPKKSDLDSDSDFDRVRNTPEFQAFRESLPE
jgi:hypothetical protein